LHLGFFPAKQLTIKKVMLTGSETSKKPKLPIMGGFFDGGSSALAVF